jgi:hypothetical protein
MTPLVAQAQHDVSRANCAGRGCPERKECRRYVTRIAVVGSSRAQYDGHEPVGLWCSFDIERSLFGNCASFVRQQFNRPARRGAARKPVADLPLVQEC